MEWTRRVYIVGCSKEKQTQPAQARYMYTSRHFKAAFSYAEHYGTEIFILSAKYGLIPPEKVIEPYDVQFGKGEPHMCIGESILFEQGMALQLSGLRPKDERIFLIAGKEYLDRLSAARVHAQPLFFGLSIGQIYSHLTRNVTKLKEEAWRELGCPLVMTQTPQEITELSHKHQIRRIEERDAIRRSRRGSEMDLR